MKIGNRAAAAATACVLAGTGLVAAAAPAAAYPWDPHVLLNGKAECTYSTSNTVSWVYVSASDGEAGFAGLGGGGLTRNYTFQFNRVGTGGVTVTAKWGCAVDGTHATTFGLNRPSSSNYATRNLCYWSGCF